MSLTCFPWPFLNYQIFRCFSGLPGARGNHDCWLVSGYNRMLHRVKTASTRSVGRQRDPCRGFPDFASTLYAKRWFEDNHGVTPVRGINRSVRATGSPIMYSRRNNLPRVIVDGALETVASPAAVLPAARPTTSENNLSGVRRDRIVIFSPAHRPRVRNQKVPSHQLPKK